MTGRKPLEGIRVADFSWIGVGPICTKYLADFGAQVIKIESGERLDTLRTAWPFIDGIPGIERSGHWLPLNTSKEHVLLNMGRPQAREVARRLIAVSDVVVENFTSRVMRSWGLDYGSVRRIRPDIVMLSISIEGRTGPHASYLGFGTVLQSAAGITHLQGWPDRYPAPPGTAYTDWVVGHSAVIALLAALDHRRRTGEGQYIDMSCLEAGVNCLETAILDYTINGRIQERVGNQFMADEHPAAAPHGAYPCRGEDRWCAIAVFSDEDWYNLRRALGDPAWTQDPRFDTLLGRVEYQEELDRHLTEWTREHTAEEVMYILQEAGVAAGVVESAQDIRNDPQLRHRGQVVWLEHPDTEEPVPYDVPPFRFSSIPAQLRRPPSLGESTHYVCREVLGLAEEVYERLAHEEVFE